MIIYRVENDQKVGPYHGSGTSDWMEGSHWDENHPNPSIDTILSEIVEKIHKDYKYGFKNTDQLYNWFTINELIALKERGFNIVEIETNNYIIGDKQVVFEKRICTKVIG